MKLWPFAEVASAVLERKLEGYHFCQQFNCAGCGRKQTMGLPDILFERGVCEECGHETDIKHDGCNYMLYTGKTVHDLVLDLANRDPRTRSMINDMLRQKNAKPKKTNDPT
jgi:hypothetical protein